MSDTSPTTSTAGPLCVCGDLRSWHDHFRAGTECSRPGCSCVRFRRRRLSWLPTRDRDTGTAGPARPTTARRNPVTAPTPDRAPNAAWTPVLIFTGATGARTLTDPAHRHLHLVTT